MSTVTSCALLSTVVAAPRSASSSVGRASSVAPPAAVAPFSSSSSSQRRSRSLSVCCAVTPKGEHNPKTDLHPFNISPVALVNPVPPREGREERWQIEEDAIANSVNLWFQVPGQTKEDLIVEIDEDVLVIKKKAKPLAGAENTDPKSGRTGPGQPAGPADRPPAANGKTETAPADGDVICARLLLPAGYSKERVAAELKSGVLKVSIAKIKEQVRRKIDVPIQAK